MHFLSGPIVSGATANAAIAASVFQVEPSSPDSGWHTSSGFARLESYVSVTPGAHPAEPVPIIELGLTTAAIGVALYRFWRR
jgi:hypothetical protein